MTNLGTQRQSSDNQNLRPEDYSEYCKNCMGRRFLMFPTSHAKRYRLLRKNGRENQRHFHQNQPNHKYIAEIPCP